MQEKGKFNWYDFLEGNTNYRNSFPGRPTFLSFMKPISVGSEDCWIRLISGVKKQIKENEKGTKAICPTRGRSILKLQITYSLSSCSYRSNSLS